MSTAHYDPVEILGQRFRAAIAAAFPEAADADPLITATKNTALGDFQSNAAMPLAKRVGKPPRDIAAAIVAKADIGDIAEPLTPASIAGPGFINIRLRPDTLASYLAHIDSPTLGVPPPHPRETIVVDLCGVNLAKEMHVGHLRATIIGDALARTFERLGHEVKRQNHLGDWGLPIAMVTGKIKDLAEAGQLNLDTLKIDDLDRYYKAAQRDCAADEAGLRAVHRFGLGPKALAELEEQVNGAREATTRAKSTLLKLQAHDPTTYSIWKRIADLTVEACVTTCARLHANVRPEHTAGESSYSEELGPVVEDLVKRGIAEESEGALVIRVEGIEEPCIIRKSDGGFLYATTDLAAIRRRVGKLGGDRLIYCVDARQSLHFKQVFAAADKAGYTLKKDGGRARLQHAAFGMVLGDDGRPFKTRSGENIRLMALIDEARDRALAAVTQRSPDMPENDRATIAEAVGVAAIKYADLSNDRVKDYIFNFDRMLAFEGNTGPYLLYALVRVRSIFRKAAERGLDAGAAWKSAPLVLGATQEKLLALTLLRYAGTLDSVAESLEPHRLCQYLYDLAGAFSSFFDACPVLQAPDEATRNSRLRLCDLTARVLADGLTVLGIPPLDRM
ncbi:MAG: arginine--tRNA ligase [Phycisphaerales bacterium]|nr:arginine--tRNA ligase [Phycisphaerales bacterium]